MNHTKGKWEVSMFMTYWTAGGTKIKAWVNSIGVGEIEPHSGKRITNIAHIMSGETREESEADAKLIAAAPELMEALKAMYKVSKDSIDKYSDDELFAHRKMVIAIKKAEA